MKEGDEEAQKAEEEKNMTFYERKLKKIFDKYPEMTEEEQAKWTNKIFFSVRWNNYLKRHLKLKPNKFEDNPYYELIKDQMEE